MTEFWDPNDSKSKGQSLRYKVDIYLVPSSISSKNYSSKVSDVLNKRNSETVKNEVYTGETLLLRCTVLVWSEGLVMGTAGSRARGRRKERERQEETCERKISENISPSSVSEDSIQISGG